MNRPHTLADTSLHSWGNAERLMDANEVVPHVEQRHGVRLVFDLVAEVVRRSGEAAMFIRIVRF